MKNNLRESEIYNCVNNHQRKKQRPQEESFKRPNDFLTFPGVIQINTGNLGKSFKFVLKKV